MSRDGFRDHRAHSTGRSTSQGCAPVERTLPASDLEARKKIVELIRAGGESNVNEAFRLCLQTHSLRTRLHRCIVRLLRTVPNIADVAREGEDILLDFLNRKLVVVVTSAPGEIRSLDALLFTALRQHTIGSIRHALAHKRCNRWSSHRATPIPTRAPSWEVADPGPSPEASVAESLLRAAIDRAIDEVLDEEDKQLLLDKIGGASHQDLATKYGLTCTNVGVRISRIRQRLLVALEGRL